MFEEKDREGALSTALERGPKDPRRAVLPPPKTMSPLVRTFESRFPHLLALLQDGSRKFHSLKRSARSVTWAQMPIARREIEAFGKMNGAQKAIEGHFDCAFRVAGDQLQICANPEAFKMLDKQLSGKKQ